MPHTKGHDTGSVSFNEMPSYDAKYEDAELMKKWDKLLSLREDVKKALENARNEKVIGASLEAHVTIYCNDETFAFVDSIKADLPTVFIASKVSVVKNVDIEKSAEKFLGVAIEVEKAEGQKCERCWMYVDELSKDEEHETLCPRCAAIVKEL